MPTIGPFKVSAGLNTRAGNFNLPRDQATVLSDCFPVYGNVVNRISLVKCNSSATAKTTGCGITSWIDPAQAVVSANAPLIVVVATDNSTKKIYSGVMNTSEAITYTDVTGTATLSGNQSDTYQFASLNKFLIGTGGALQGDKPFKISAYNGNAAALGGSPPSGNAMVVANNFLFISRDLSSTAKFSRVYWSAVQDPETWPAASNIDFRLNDGDMITALSTIGEDLIIFKTRSMGRLSTTTTSVSGTVTLAPLTTISESIGCPNPSAVTKMPDGRIIFVDNNNHVRIYDGSSYPIDVSDQMIPGPSIQPSLDSGGQFAVFANPPISIQCLPRKNQVWVIAATGGVISYYVYNYLENAWNSASLGSSLPNTIAAMTNAFPAWLGSDPLTSHLLMQDNNGFTWSVEGGGSLGPTDTSGANITPNVTTSIQLPDNFVPRTLMIPAILGSGASLTVTLGWNGTLLGTTLTAITRASNRLWNLFDIRQGTFSMGRPLTMQVQIQVTAGKTFTLYPFYVSDEVLQNVS